MREREMSACQSRAPDAAGRGQRGGCPGNHSARYPGTVYQNLTSFHAHRLHPTSLYTEILHDKVATCAASVTDGVGLEPTADSIMGRSHLKTCLGPEAHLHEETSTPTPTPRRQAKPERRLSTQDGDR
ncbi:hypothetical protein CDAR_307971 [Caerostris darwini]|uniref:Uncharacterized protein n=1 Tax=Caerostris darwini TaxID=1538125 RepID=A0AAV4P6I0_9ARAC|nr:hypothetical protein CDAR_307971 [Caerostris darwini]